MFPNHVVIGVDRSFVRLHRNPTFRRKRRSRDTNNRPTDRKVVNTQEEWGQGDNTLIQPMFSADMDSAPDIAKEGENDDDEPENDIESSAVETTLAISDNVLLVRAELSDFWRCCWEAGWKLDRHYLLYPNPYPLKKSLKSRWYAHPSFPVLLALGGTLVVRSNWGTYLEEFSKSIVYSAQSSLCPAATPYLPSAQARAPKQLQAGEPGDAWTNFEEKYHACGEVTYELILPQQ
mmetsp:Transcript_560/g.1326  ORF Transcript_560/g.1326 Transcript_560/m.1326 type:complete len:234 (+) Transcript_560:217-918(+)